MTPDDTPEEDAAAEAVYDGIVHEVDVESARGNQEMKLRGAGAPSSGIATSDVCNAVENAGETEEKEDTQSCARGVSKGSHGIKQAADEKDGNGKAEGDGAPGEGAHATDGPEAKKRKTEGGDEPEKQPGEAPASPVKAAAITTPASSPIKARVDIYGRAPGREPPFPVPCPNCHRSLAASRMASHLEKCLGISSRSTSRKASSASGSTGSKGSSGRASGTKGRGGKGGRQGKQAKRKSSR